MAVEFDHLVVAAATLDQGVAWVENRLGVTCRPGGRHPKMGTHNALVRLGEARYLEVIAAEPNVDAPSAPRWFALDDPVIRDALAAGPRLLTWVARCDDLDATLARCGYAAGTPRDMTRGALCWRIAFGDDGRLQEGGLVPALIEWGAPAAQPADSLPDQGATLAGLRGRHPRMQAVSRKLCGLGLADTLRLQPGRDPGLQAVIDTPRGQRVLDD